MKDPLKQGLKLESRAAERRYFSQVEVKDPLKQGLKQKDWDRGRRKFLG